jgi:ATP-binding cassette subfamily B protein
MSQTHPLKQLLRYAGEWRREGWWAATYSVLNKFFDILPEILIGIAVDVVVNREASFLARVGFADPVDQLLVLSALTVLVWALESLTEYAAVVRWRNLAQNLQHKLRIEAYEHLQRIEPGKLEQIRTGRVMAVLNEDVHQIERFLNSGAHNLIQVFFSTLLVGGVFFYLSPGLAGVAVLPVPLIIVGAFWFLARLAPRYAAAREAASAVSQRLANNILGMGTIQAYTAERYEALRLMWVSDDYRVRNADAIRVSAAISPVIRMAILAGFTATLLYGGILALRGDLGVGSYSALVFLTQRLLWPLTGLAEMTDLYQRAMTSVERVMELMATPAAVDTPRASLPSPSTGAIRIEDLHFSYGEVPVLDGLNLDIPGGTTVGLVGGTGSGKSTLLKQILRFETPDSGVIHFDGVRVEDLSRYELRSAIGFVAQDPFLTDGTFLENVAYGDPNPDLGKVDEAARAAEAYSFIAASPSGYATAVGERGLNLSGGQRQRIALARALYRDPALLILDEATSAVDNETEAAIQRSLARIAGARTILIVAHRLSTVRHADRIHVMDGGRIVESGSHEVLLDLGGIYASLWRLQTGESV